LLVACGSDKSSSAGDDGGASGGDDSGAGKPPLVPLAFTASAGDIVNPERGFHTNGMTVADGTCAYNGDLSHVRDKGMSLVRIYVRLDAFRGGPISAGCLTALGSLFDSARAGGVKIILRFSYNFAQGDPDAPKSVVLGHIAQLAPFLAQQADVIATMQAGFVGAWGEWHDSTNGLDNPAVEKEIVTALLAALPVSRTLQIRTPAQKKALYGGPMPDSDAFSGSPASRIGHHNDCFLASVDDWGTYVPAPVQPWKDFIAQEGKYTPVGVETCNYDPPRSDCATALQELAELHMSYVNADYQQQVLAGWTTQGCMAEVHRRLGYRFTLLDGSISERVRPGGVLRLSVRLRNDGYASPFNARPLYATIDDGTARRTALLAAIDPRRWAAGAEATIDVSLRIPADAHAGNYAVGLWLPDAAPTLADRPEYAVRFADDGTWDAATGVNVLARSLSIDPAAPGTVDATATTFEEL
jgi:hypothetical protein